MPPSSSATARTRGGFTVFEAVNNDLKEIYVTGTKKPIFEAMAEFGTHPPSMISHWRTNREQMTFRSLEFELSLEQAEEFIKRHTAKPWPAGWSYIVALPPKP